jgi:molybdopterin converting factor small subunit
MAVSVIGRTIGECLDRLEASFPEIKQKLCNAQGKLSGAYTIHSKLSQRFYSDDLAQPVRDGDELIIITVVAGG